MMGRYMHWSTRERAELFLREGLPHPFYPFLVLNVWYWPMVSVSFNMLI